MDVAILGIEGILLDERLDEEVVRGGPPIAASPVFGSDREAAEVGGSIERVRTGERGRDALPLLLLLTLPALVLAALPLKREEQQLLGRLLDLASADFLLGNIALLLRREREGIVSVLDDLGLWAGHRIGNGIGR